MPPPVLTGEFVDLVPLEPEHAACTLAWRQSPRAALLNRGAATVEQQAAWIASRPASELNWVITVKATGQAVGMLSLVDLDLHNGHAQTGRFLIGEEDAVRGVPAAAEAMKLLYQHAFDTLGLRRLYGHVAAANTQMVKWQRYLGMVEEGRWRQHWLIDGVAHDAVLLGLMADEYRRTSLPRLNTLIAAGRPRPVRATAADTTPVSA